MTRLTDRRTILLAAGTAAAAAVAVAVSAQSASQISGTVEYEGGAVIPKGQLEIRLKTTANDQTRSVPTKTSIASDGDAKALVFSLAMPVATTAPRAEITARLEREDGWLLARGSAEVADDGSVAVILYTVMY